MIWSKQKARISMIIGVFWWGALPLAQARVITIETNVQTTVARDALSVVIQITNRGDEEARNVYVKVESPGDATTSEIRPGLPPETTHTLRLQHSLKKLSAGLYPLIITTHYADANGYPFSALTVASVQIGQSRGAGIVALMEKAEVRSQGRVKLRLKNVEAQDKTLHIRFLAPDEISAQPPRLEKPLPAQGEAEVSFAVKNFSALPGSTYFVAALIELTQNGLHEMAVSPSSLVIREAGLFPLKASTGIALAIGVLFLVGLIGGRIVWEKRRRTPPVSGNAQKTKAG